MGPRCRRALPVIALIGLLAVVPVAESSRPPVARIACAGAATGNCTESGKITTPANGTGIQSTDVVPDKSTQGSEWVRPVAAGDLDEFDATWESVVAGFPKLGGIKNTLVRRVLTCAVLSVGITDVYGKLVANHTGSATADKTDTSQLFMTLCLQMVAQAQAAAGATKASRAAATPSCSKAVVSLPIQIRRSGSKYIAQFDATPTRAANAPLRVSCRGKGSGILIGMRPRRRAKKLHQVIGAHMLIGLSNPTNRPLHAETTFSFAR